MLQFPINKPASKIGGFTLIETLVTVSIISLLSAIALPSFIGQINRAKETEAKIAINTLKKGQYSFYLENSRFADDIGQLEFSQIDNDPGTKKYIETENYVYAVFGDPRLNGMLHLALSQKKGVRSYGSVVHLKDGLLEECGPFSLDISKGHSELEILRFALDALTNYQRYCS